MKRTFKFIAMAAMAVITSLSCTKEQNVKTHSRNDFHFVVTTAENVPVKSFIANNLDGTYTPKWSANDELAVFIGTINSSVSTPTGVLTNQNGESTTAKFDGTITGVAEEGSFVSFSPKSAFNSCYTNGEVGINLKSAQKPSKITIDESCDVLVAKPCDYIADGETVAINELFFKRIFSVLKVNIKGDASLNGKNLNSLKLTAPGGVVLAGRASVDLTTATISKWTVSESSVSTTYTEGEGPTFGNETEAIYFVVNPTTIPANSEIIFEGETAEYNISKTVSLSKDLVMPESQIAVINLSLTEANCTYKVTETRIYVENFKNVEENKTKVEASATGVAGTGVTETLKYEYTGENTNIRFNNSGHSSSDPYLYLVANGAFSASNIAVKDETTLKFSCQTKTNSGTASVVLQWKESSETTWNNAGTFSASTSSFDDVQSAVINVPSTATSLDLKLSSATAALVDDMVLESFVDNREKLSVPENVSVTLDAETANKVLVSWNASAKANGYEVALSAEGKDDVIKTVTKTSLELIGLAYSTTYSVKVKATTTDTDNFIDSDYSAPVEVTTGERQTGGETTVTFTFDQGAGQKDGLTWTDGTITVIANTGNGTNAPNEHANDKQLRFYGKNTLTISGATIKTVIFNVGTWQSLSATSGTIDSNSKSWTATSEVSTLTFTNTATSQAKYNSITVTYE